jgi:hypothetical protein
VKLPKRAVAVGFLDAPPVGLEKFEGTEPSGCSFWRLSLGCMGNRVYTGLGEDEMYFVVRGRDRRHWRTRWK